jgi:hypothetical protein
MVIMEAEVMGTMVGTQSKEKRIQKEERERQSECVCVGERH